MHLSNGCFQDNKHPEFGNIFVWVFSPPRPSTPAVASGEPAGLCPTPHRALPKNSLASSTAYVLLGTQEAWMSAISPALLLAQVSELDTGLVALEAEGQELLLELEKNQ